MRNLLFKLLFLLQVPRVCRYLNRNKITIVTYHGFTDKEHFAGIENDQGMHLNIAAFRRHLEYLKGNYTLVPLSDVIDHYTTGKKLPKYPAVITIDDGFQSVYTLAYPVLKEFNVPASVFVTTGFVGNSEPLWYDRVQYAMNVVAEPSLELSVRDATCTLTFRDQSDRLLSVRKFRQLLKAIDQEQLPALVEELEQKSSVRLLLDGSEPEIYSPLSWDQISEMVRGGLVSVGSHTSSHVILSRCTPEKMRQELVCSKEIIEQRLGGECDTFCYPNGTAEDFNDFTRQQLEELGYRCGLTTVAGANDLESDPLELKRFSAPEDLAEFAVTISGVRLFLTRRARAFFGE